MQGVIQTCKRSSSPGAHVFRQAKQRWLKCLIGGLQAVLWLVEKIVKFVNRRGPAAEHHAVPGLIVSLC